VTTGATEVDVAVLGGGPGGYATGLRAAARGLSVALVEEDAVGGTCLHRGCIPSKALLHAGAIADQLRQAPGLGFPVEVGEISLPKLHAFRDGIVERLHRGLLSLIATSGITTLAGRGAIRAPGVIDVSTSAGDVTQVHAPDIVVATGSRPAELAVAPIDGRTVITSNEALALHSIPRRGLIVGGGAVGVEFASLWNSLGTDVILVEALDRLLPLEEPDSSSVLSRAFHQRGIEVRTSARLEALDRHSSGVRAHVGDEAFDVDCVLVAVGRQPLTSGIGLEPLGVLDEGGYVKVDSRGRTRASGTWAVGDVIPTLGLAHAAVAEGLVVADAIAGLDPRPVEHDQVPRVTFSQPQVASVGLNEVTARSRYGNDVTTTVERLVGNARAIIDDVFGLMKVVAAPDGRVVGVHLVGPGVTELIAGAAMATSWDAYVDEVAAIAFPHPTLSEGMREAMLAAAGLPLHAMGTTHG
jgi:dihydrolipoamide dehydrogenase